MNVTPVWARPRYETPELRRARRVEEYLLHPALADYSPGARWRLADRMAKGDGSTSEERMARALDEFLLEFDEATKSFSRAMRNLSAALKGR